MTNNPPGTAFQRALKAVQRQGFKCSDATDCFTFYTPIPKPYTIDEFFSHSVTVYNRPGGVRILCRHLDDEPTYVWENLLGLKPEDYFDNPHLGGHEEGGNIGD